MLSKTLLRFVPTLKPSRTVQFNDAAIDLCDTKTLELDLTGSFHIFDILEIYYG